MRIISLKVVYILKQKSKHLEQCSSERGVAHTDVVHPADVGGGAGEDCGLPVGVAAGGGHEAGHTVDHPLAVDAAVQGATRVTLRGSSDRTYGWVENIQYFHSAEGPF